MEFQKRQFLRMGKRAMAFVVVAVLASLMLASAGPAHAKRMLGTKGPDKIVGTAKADVIKARGGNDRIKGRGGRDRLSGGPGRDRLSGGRGRDRLSGGRGADRLNAVDGRRDRVVNGGPGKDVCRVDAVDRAKMKGCETVKIGRGGGPGGGPGGPAVPAAARSAPPLRRAPGSRRRPGAGCAGGRAADLQRSVLRDHDNPQRLGGWVERR